MQLDDILQKFEITNYSVIIFGNGLINKTWVIDTGNKSFILQQINQNVFECPEDIAFNIQLIGDHLTQNHPEYLFIAPVKTKDGKVLIKNEEGYFRIFPFIKNSHTINIVQTPQQAYEAAKQFGKFSKMLSGFNADQLKITIPDFHDLSLRYKQFEDAL